MKNKSVIIILVVFCVVAIALCGYVMIKDNVFTLGAYYASSNEHKNITNEISNVDEEKVPTYIQVSGDTLISIVLLDGWSYDYITETSDVYYYALKFYKSSEDNKMMLYAYKDMFGVCGTELEIKEMELDNGNNVMIGYYGDSEKWTFINLGDNVILQDNSLTLEESNEALSMIKAINIEN